MEIKGSRSVVSDSWRPHGLQPPRLLPSMGFSRQECCSGLPVPSLHMSLGLENSRAASSPLVLPPSCVLLTVVTSHQETNAEEAVLQRVMKDTEKQTLTARSLINRCSPFLKFTLSE